MCPRLHFAGGIEEPHQRLAKRDDLYLFTHFRHSREQLVRAGEEVDHYAVPNKPARHDVLLWSLHLVCSQQVTSPMDLLSDIHPALQTQSSTKPKHTAKIRWHLFSHCGKLPSTAYGNRINTAYKQLLFISLCLLYVGRAHKAAFNHGYHVNDHQTLLNLIHITCTV